MSYMSAPVLTYFPPSIKFSCLNSSEFNPRLSTFSLRTCNPGPSIKQSSLDMNPEQSKWKTVRRHVEAKDFGAAVESASTSTDGESVTEARPRGWGRLREEYVGRQKVIVNDIGGLDNPNEGIGKTAGGNKSLVSFFNVVREASAVEKKRKERPTLLKFLEKFDSVDIPESVTPGVQPGFSHFECDQGNNDNDNESDNDGYVDNEDDDTKLLRSSIHRTSGVSRELAVPKVHFLYLSLLSFSISQIYLATVFVL